MSQWCGEGGKCDGATGTDAQCWVGKWSDCGGNSELIAVRARVVREGLIFIFGRAQARAKVGKAKLIRTSKYRFD